MAKPAFLQLRTEIAGKRAASQTDQSPLRPLYWAGFAWMEVARTRRASPEHGQVLFSFEVLITLTGNSGYHWQWKKLDATRLDASFMTVIKITTIGFGIAPSDFGKRGPEPGHVTLLSPFFRFVGRPAGQSGRGVPPIASTS